MARVAAAAPDTRTVSDLLAAVELRGRSWCYTDLGAQAGFAVPRADAVLFHAVLHGTVRVACTGGEVAELSAGDAVMVLSGEAHALRTAPRSLACQHEFLRADTPVDIPPTFAIGAHGRIGARLLSGRLRASWPDEASRAALPSMLDVGARAGTPLAALLRPEALPLAGTGAGSAALLTRLASLMLAAALRADPRCRQIFAPQQRDPIAEALRIIGANPSADWTVERLARSVGMGRSNFAGQFTQVVGRAPMEVVAEQRMEHAAALLRRGKLKIAEISEMAGYGSEAAFSRRFTRHFGVTPSQMRAAARAEKAAGAGEEPGFVPLLASRLVKDAAVLSRRRARQSCAAPAEGPARAVLPVQSTLLLRGTRD